MGSVCLASLQQGTYAVAFGDRPHNEMPLARGSVSCIALELANARIVILVILDWHPARAAIGPCGLG